MKQKSLPLYKWSISEAALQIGLLKFVKNVRFYVLTIYEYKGMDLCYSHISYINYWTDFII